MIPEKSPIYISIWTFIELILFYFWVIWLRHQTFGFQFFAINLNFRFSQRMLSDVSAFMLVSSSVINSKSLMVNLFPVNWIVIQTNHCVLCTSFNVCSAFWYKSQAMALVVLRILKQRLYLIIFLLSWFYIQFNFWIIISLQNKTLCLYLK
jgi:hypothetical protein